MNRRQRKRSIRMIAALLVGMLFAILTVPLAAQTPPDSPAVRGFGPVYDVAHETTLIGTIQEVVTTHVTGSPAGMHLLVIGPRGIVDTHVGSFLSKETKESMQAGALVRIVGAPILLHGKEYFLARQLTVGGSTVTLRSEHGLLVRASSHVELNGGAR
jgi:hypothetical protein